MDMAQETAIPVSSLENGESEATVMANQPSVVSAEDSTAPSMQTHVEETTASDSECSSTEVYTPVYNGEIISVKASDREEITTLLQLGMKQRDLLPMYEQMTRLAKEEGEPSLKAWVEKRVQEREEMLRLQAVERYGEEDGARFYEMERREREERYRSLSEEQHRRDEERAAWRDRHEAMAEEFCALCAMHPDVTAFRQVPDEVFRVRQEEGISLLDAFNRVKLLEERRVQKAHEASRVAAETATGSLAASPEAPPSAIEAFRAGLRRRA
ncbi:MAG: hypothetical protein IJB27_01585 [Clostridia bacterium]|nr:hypothetical protein [Clostridia bacterium]